MEDDRNVAGTSVGKYKEPGIRWIVKHLQERFGAERLLIKDFWDGDNCAIGLTNQSHDKLIYISTLKSSEQYFVELETTAETNDPPYTTDARYETVSITQLEDLVKKHLRIFTP